MLFLYNKGYLDLKQENERKIYSLHDIYNVWAPPVKGEHLLKGNLLSVTQHFLEKGNTWRSAFCCVASLQSRWGESTHNERVSRIQWHANTPVVLTHGRARYAVKHVVTVNARAYHTDLWMLRLIASWHRATRSLDREDESCVVFHLRSSNALTGKTLSTLFSLLCSFHNCSSFSFKQLSL